MKACGTGSCLFARGGGRAVSHTWIREVKRLPEDTRKPGDTPDARSQRQKGALSPKWPFLFMNVRRLSRHDACGGGDSVVCSRYAPDLLVSFLGLQQLDQRVAHRASPVVQVLQLPVLGLVVSSFRRRGHDGSSSGGDLRTGRNGWSAVARAGNPGGARHVLRRGRYRRHRRRHRVRCASKPEAGACARQRVRCTRRRRERTRGEIVCGFRDTLRFSSCRLVASASQTDFPKVDH